jgi:MFS family permease
MRPIHLLVAYLSLNQTALLGVRFAAVLYAVSHPYSPAIVGMLLSLYSISPLLGAVHMGRWADRVGTRVPLVSCCIAMLAGALMMALSQDLWVLCLAALIWGGGGFGQHVLANTLAGRSGSSEERSSNFVMLTMGIAAANAIAPYAIGLVIDHVGNYALIFALLGLMPLAGLFLMRMAAFPQSEGRPAGETVQKKAALQLLRNADLRPIMLVSTVFVLLWDVVAVVTPLHGKALGFSASQIGLIASAFSVASFAVRVVLSPLARRYRPWRLLHCALLVAAAGLVGFGLATDLSLLVVCAFIIGAGQGVGAPLSSTVMYDVAPPDRLSEANGLRLSMGMATHTFLPLLVGGVGAIIGVAPFLWLGGLLLCGTVLWYRRYW